MNTWVKRGIAAAAALATATVGAVAGHASTGYAASTSMQAFGIDSTGTLMASFWTDKPQQLDWVRTVTGLVGDTALVGIDIRVQDGQLYGVGNKGGIYTIGIPSVVTTKVSQLAVPLNGTAFGVDFNPAADRLRVISDFGQNLRHNLNDHTTITDGTLSLPQSSISTATGVTGAAYTNNDLDASTGTTLFDLDTYFDQIVIQSPANTGMLVPTGFLGVDASTNAGFDIFSDLTNGKATAVLGFATIVPKGSSSASLWSINLLSGAATNIGTFPLQITDVAVALDAG